jgi:putative DNA primase/helicase
LRLVCSPLEIVALTRDTDGREWGRLLVIEDPDGKKHDWAMPMSLLAGDGTACREELLSLGLRIAPGPKTRGRLQLYISMTQPRARVRCVTRTGWHGSVYVLPTATYGVSEEKVILQTATLGAHRIRISGTLAEWQREVAKFCVGNSRLAFAVSSAFAATLLYPADEESGGFHFRGASSIGKTTVLRAAGSVWGGGGANGYITTWRATSNGLEAVAARNCDGLLCLDELGQLPAREAGEVAYMLANGVGKSRAKRDGTAQASVTWRLLWLSTGEPSLADRMREVGQRARAGQETRLVDIPADAGGGLGIFEKLHEFCDGDRLARHLRDATGRLYGVPIQDFLIRAASDVDALADAVRAGRRRWIESNCPKGADGQVVRVAARFALVAAAGELATTMGLLPWPDGEAQRSATSCFRAWLGARGGIGAAEIAASIEQVRAFIEAHGTSRFGRCGEPDHTVVNRVGFRRDDGEGKTDYLVLPESWRNELCAGYDARAVAHALLEKGHLAPDQNDDKLQSRHRLPGLGTQRVYHLRSSILDGAGDYEDNRTRLDA